ncbi:MAG: BatA domain-containing protein [Chthoniobacteraceae bacterium]|jgi:hypothetical protein
MTFLNPWLLAGAAAIAAPVIIHMMARLRVRRINWAAMRFLKAAVQKNRRRLRVEDLLLLALRCLLLILLAVALARPAFRAAGAGAVGGPRTVVIALDNSCGMGLTDGGASRFDNGRKAATRIVDSLPPGSRAAFLLFSDVSRPVIAEPVPDLNLVRRMIAEARLTDRASNVHPVIREALDILKRHAPPGGGQLFLITDGQITGWSDLSAIRNEVSDSGAHLVIVEPGPGDQPNLGISDLQLASPLAVASRFSIAVTNYGRDEARNVTVGLSIDGQPPGDQAVIDSIPPGETRAVSLFAKARTPGYHAVTAQLPPDHLAADDRRTMVIRAAAEVRVLLVAGDMGATPREGDAFFLERALTPVPPEDRPAYFIRTQTISASDLDGAKFADFDAVALLNVPRLDGHTIGALEAFVQAGGGLMFFPGGNTDVKFFDSTLGSAGALDDYLPGESANDTSGGNGPSAGGDGFLPADMGRPWGGAQGQGTFRTLQGPPYPHPLVSIWQDPASGTLTTARFYKGIALELPPSGSGTNNAAAPVTILKYSDGSPAIVERSWGSGLVIQFSSSANAAWNDLPAHPAFVPLMQRALGRLVTRRDEGLNIRVGDNFNYPAPPDWLYKGVTIAGPGGKGQPKGSVALVAGAPLLRCGDTDFAGACDVAIATDPPTKLIFAAQTDPDESKLEPVPDMELETLAPGTQVIHWNPATPDELVSSGDGREFWPLFASLALAVACCESFLAGRFSAAK